MCVCVFVCISVCVKGVGGGVMYCVGGNKNYTHGRDSPWVSELGEH